MRKGTQTALYVNTDKVTEHNMGLTVVTQEGGKSKQSRAFSF